jgi:para-aminobenzoate synthetase
VGAKHVHILLIDNYDSFTYNLFHLLARVCGTEPTVMKNDDWQGWKSLDLADFDSAVISPGPGRPQRPDDVGLSRAVIASGRLPVLGICLGHQEICYASGATIRVADEPVHGQVSPINHLGNGLFAGIPASFEAVRYHSLEVTDLPAELIVTATAQRRSGGEIVMAVEHRHRPLWGVQFHPESILTQYGEEIIRNFRRLAEPTPRHSRACGNRQQPAGNISQPRQREQRPDPDNWQIQARQADRTVDCYALFAELFADNPWAFWLDSSRVTPGVSRFSIMGHCGPHGELITVRAGTGQVRVESADGSVQVKHTSLFDYLKNELGRRKATITGVPFDFSMGYVGYFGYELKADCGADQVHYADADDAALIFCDQAIVIDHDQDKLWVLALSRMGTARGWDEWWTTAERAISRVRAGAAGQLSQSHRAPGCRSAAAGDHQPKAADLRVTYRHGTQQYETLVRDCLDEIRRGESYEICLTNMATVHVKIDPMVTYQKLRQYTPVPYGAFLKMPSMSVMSASPECFLRVSPNGRVQTKPIKGTRPRGATPEEDEWLRADLAGAEKDRSENLMIVDLLRNDLGRVAAVGSVRVTALFEVETYAPVHQLVSTVEAQLKHGLTAVDCLREAFPGGSMTGAPKIRTMQIIDRLEDGPRGVYSGTIGYLSLNGAAHFSIVIRTLVAHEDTVTVGSGGAIVALSDPKEEVDEMLLKALTPLNALRDSMNPASADDEIAG